jgi:PIN domain nuclease of toxin-antitoxin system
LIYLDTHVLVWLYAGQVEQFSDSVQALLNEQDLLISPMVQLELQYLHEIKRVTVTADTIIADLAQRLGLAICPKPFTAIIAQATQASWTRDPFDRIIVAHAGLDNNILISKDQTIRDHYALAQW